jgi:hypothetical protein
MTPFVPLSHASDNTDGTQRTDRMTEMTANNTRAHGLGVEFTDVENIEIQL